MELKNFTEFEPFNALRKKMGTEQFGYFELFDPVLHLTGTERSQLEQVGVLQKLAAVKVLPDQTLAMKNSRVLAYNPDENWYRVHREYPTYHIAFCARLEAMKSAQFDLELLLTSKIADDYPLLTIRPGGEVSVAAHGVVVCKHCLHRLRYKDFDEFRNRRRGYSQKVLQEFSLHEYYRLYQQYPLSFGGRRV